MLRLSWNSWGIAWLVGLAVGPAASGVVACDLCRRCGGLTLDSAEHGDADGAGDPAPAFVLQGGQWPQPGGPGSPVTLSYSFENLLDGSLRGPDGVSLDGSLIRTSVEEALGLWASVAPLHFVEVPDDGLSYAAGAREYGQLRFRHVYINGPDPPPPADPVAKARAYFPSGGGSLAGDVEFDRGDPWQQSGTLSVPDVLGAAIHEIGHTLGLGHTNVEDANMYWIFHRFSGPGSGELFPDDIAGVRAIYGAGLGSVRPLAAVPEPVGGGTLLMAMLLILCGRRKR